MEPPTRRRVEVKERNGILVYWIDRKLRKKYSLFLVSEFFNRKVINRAIHLANELLNNISINVTEENIKGKEGVKEEWDNRPKEKRTPFAVFHCPKSGFTESPENRTRSINYTTTSWRRFAKSWQSLMWWLDVATEFDMVIRKLGYEVAVHIGIQWRGEEPRIRSPHLQFWRDFRNAAGITDHCLATDVVCSNAHLPKAQHKFHLRRNESARCFDECLLDSVIRELGYKVRSTLVFRGE